MMQHLNQPVNVSAFSAMAGLSNSSFFVLFKSVTGWTPMNFFIRARMRLACQLLVETTLRIKEIADWLGYDDQYYFRALSSRSMALHRVNIASENRNQVIRISS